MSYVIADEPHETPWRHLVVSPSGPLLASMLCGDWLALPWFAFNAVVMGSPSKRREIALCAGSFAGTALLALILVSLVRHGVIQSDTVIRLCLLGIVTWKLTMVYVIHQIQNRTFEVYEYYGGTVRSANVVVSTGYLLSGFVIGAIDDPIWRIIVSVTGGALS